MAKYGEGDKRWIVEERPDGANVHNWHWAERNCLEWSRALLSSLLSDLPLLSSPDGLTIRTRSLDKLDGEAYVNVRKGKVIPGYELSLSLSWDAQTPDLKLTGTADIPYLADENAAEDPELRVTITTDAGPAGAQIKDAFLAVGKPIILDKVRLYVEAMAKGGPAKDELEVKKPGAKVSAPAAPAPVPAVPAKKEKEKKKAKEGFKTIAVTERFNLPARIVYETLMDENSWKGFTQSNARISKEVGGEFSLFDGSVTGVNEELQHGKLIVQKWRFGSWADGVYSTVRLEFDEPEHAVTIVKLIQTNVPEEDKYGNATVAENTERGWRDLIFGKIHKVFGFGI